MLHPLSLCDFKKLEAKFLHIPRLKCTVTYSRGRWCTWHGACSLIGYMSACRWRRCCRSRWWQTPPTRRPSVRCWPAGPRRTRCHLCWVCSCAHVERSHSIGISWSSFGIKKKRRVSSYAQDLRVYLFADAWFGAITAEWAVFYRYLEIRNSDSVVDLILVWTKGLN